MVIHLKTSLLVHSQCANLCKMLILMLGLLAAAAVSANPSSDNKDAYKDQHCTDPRTMKKHPAYTEWADAYSCTRHRCQPGGRNLAIYTVGCKRVEAPESAIECEEVVEDTNMQFPFCCTRLRCLVVVRGEVWTRVLGQPWEVLPAAPWSHMYKMKKPPPADSTLFSKSSFQQGPVYELSENESETVGHSKVLRSGKKQSSDNSDTDAASDCNEKIPLSTNKMKDEKSRSKYDRSSYRRFQKKYDNNSRLIKRFRKANSVTPTKSSEEDLEKHDPAVRVIEELPVSTDKYAHNSMSWTEIPLNQWNEPREGADVENQASELNNEQPETPQELPELKQEEIHTTPSNKDEKPNFQALVDAIGTRMRDIEHVVQKMSDKVRQVKSGEGSNEKRLPVNINRGNKYLHSTADGTQLTEDTNFKGYFNDASNSVMRRNIVVKEPPPIYMAPVESRRKAPVIVNLVSSSEDTEKKRKKHAHKKKKGKGSHSHRKHSRSKDVKCKHFSKLVSGETENNNVVSLEDNSALTK